MLLQMTLFHTRTISFHMVFIIKVSLAFLFIIVLHERKEELVVRFM